MDKMQKAKRIRDNYKSQIINIKYGKWPVYFQNWLNRTLAINLLITDLRYTKERL